MTVQAYINAGRWIGDCDRTACANAELLTPHQGLFACSNCKQLSGIEWPPDPDGITGVLASRPVPQTRNWAPAGHRQAIACGYPEGQSIADLCDENREHSVT